MPGFDSSEACIHILPGRLIANYYYYFFKPAGVLQNAMESEKRQISVIRSSTGGVKKPPKTGFWFLVCGFWFVDSG